MFRKRHIRIILILARLFIAIPVEAIASEGNLMDDMAALTDYCTQYSKSSLEHYLSRVDDNTNVTDNDKYQMLGQIFSTCVTEKGQEMKNNVASSSRYDFYNYAN